MNKVVMDASALLALVNEEKGSVKVAELLSRTVMSTINYSETIMVLNKAGLTIAQATEIIDGLTIHLIDFDRQQAMEAASLRHETKKYGLSLGDRACLALAKLNQLPVITADKAWAKVNIGVDVQVIR